MHRISSFHDIDLPEGEEGNSGICNTRDDGENESGYG